MYSRTLHALPITFLHNSLSYVICNKIPCTKAKACIRIRHLVRKGEDSSGSSSYDVVPCPSTFKQIPTEAKIWVGVTDVQLVITKLPGESIRHVRFYCAGISLAKNQVSRLNVDQPPEDARG